MIAQLCGKLLTKTPPLLIIDVHGVGYEVLVPMTSFYHLPAIGETVLLHTHFVVREDAQLLFGFHNTRDRELFRTLIKVNGVGPKMALGILSGMEADELVQCVMDNDINSLVKVPGVGKKTAERMVVELRDRLTDWESALTSPDPAMAGETVGLSRYSHEAESALIALGYKAAEATRMIKSVLKDAPDLPSEELIRLALKSSVK
ncbi:MAG: Holliday junction branch migration protein RuvA [Pseudomonadales bacterium]|nr:Holliday junction branch migration protein RuvA [Pseudomonadales bacterium]